MSTNTRTRAAVVAMLMTGAAALSVLAVPANKLADTRRVIDLEQAVPKQFGSWRLDPSVVPLPPSPVQEGGLKQFYDQILSRTYINDRGERIMLLITHGSVQTRQWRVHLQEGCYASQGFAISGLDRKSVRILGAEVPLTHMVATQGLRTEPVTYWYTMGDRVVGNYWQRESTHFRYALSGYVPDGYLIRLSSLTTDGALAFAKQLAFAEKLLMQVDPDLRLRLLGYEV